MRFQQEVEQVRAQCDGDEWVATTVIVWNLSVDPFAFGVQKFTAKMINASHLANQPINSIQPDRHKKSADSIN